MHQKPLYILLAVVLLLTAVSAPAAHASIPQQAPAPGVAIAPLDLSIDANGDGVPDQLARQVAEAAGAADPQLAAAAIARALPYSARTRALQKRASQLYYGLVVAQLWGGPEATFGARQMRETASELQGLSDQMMEDPNYARAIRGLSALLAPERSGQRQAQGQTAGRETAPVAWIGLRRGDVLLVHSSVTAWPLDLYALWYDHAGIYDGHGWVYEANLDGVRRRPLSDWQRSGQYVALARDPKISAAAIASALDQSERQYGTDGRTAYNFLYPDKASDARLYCSQLVWKTYLQAGVNLDGNDWRYELWASARWGNWAAAAVAWPAVAPDEIAMASNLAIYSQGWTG